MGVQEALKDAIEFKGWTQKKTASVCNVSISAINKVIMGERKTPLCARGELIKNLDDGLLALSMVEESLEVPFITVLDGPNVDLHRGSVKDKTLEELLECFELIKEFSVSDRPGSISESKRNQLLYILNHCADASFAINHYIAIMCRDYNISFTGVWKEHRVKLKTRGYVR